MTGHDALAGMGAAIAAQYPGHRFRRTTAIDAHHNQLRFGWEFRGPDQTVVVAGVDIAELRITGFFGPLAAA